MVQGQLQAKFLSDADGGKDIIVPVGMDLQGQLALHHGDHALQLHIKGRGLARFLVLQIAAGLEQKLPQQGGHAHPGHGGLFARLTVAALGVFAEGALHGQRLLDEHLVHPAAGKLDGGEGAAHHIGAARAGAGGGHAAPQGVFQALIQRVDRVDGPHLRGDGIHDLVVVVALPAHALVVQTHMAVGLHAAGGHQPSAGVDDLGVGRRFYGLAHGEDPSVVADEDLAAGIFRSGHGLDVSVFDEKH